MPASCAARPALLTVSEGIPIRTIAAGYPKPRGILAG
jgi:hypothetical protein